MLKAAVLEDNEDPNANLPDLSPHDTKPAHFITNSIIDVHWLTKKKKACEYQNKKVIVLEFLRTSFQDSCNAWINGSDIVSQLCTAHRIVVHARNFKWR